MGRGRLVRIDMFTRRWRSIQSTIRVSWLACRGEQPATLPAVAINELHSRHDDAGFDQQDLRPRCTLCGKTRIIDGAFAACLGLYEGMADCDRVAILLDLLGRKVRVVLDGDAIAAMQ
jgi:transcriptional antiterminator RfaH